MQRSVRETLERDLLAFLPQDRVGTGATGAAAVVCAPEPKGTGHTRPALPGALVTAQSPYGITPPKDASVLIPETHAYVTRIVKQTSQM